VTVALKRCAAPEGAVPEAERAEVSAAAGPAVKELGRSDVAWEPDPSRARVVLCGGAELGAEGFELLRELAGRWNAAAVVSREAVEVGEASGLPVLEELGEVSPSLYVAFGVGGSPQHNAAVARSTVVAVVTPREGSPVAAAADLVVPFDATEVLRALVEM